MRWKANGSFLKKTLLAHLESRGAIHKALQFRPAETGEERKEAERKALRMTRRRERTAAKSGGGQPPPIEPDYRVSEYAWQLGPRPYNPDVVGESNQIIEPTETIDEAFRRAEQFELAFHENRLNEEAMIRKRKEVRYEEYRKLREQVKKEKEEDEKLGRVEDIEREAERLQAIDRIYQYAQETGEDVSEWFAELGVDTRDGFGEMEGRRLDGMMGDLKPLIRGKSARARTSGTFETQQYRRARESLLSKPTSIDFDDEVDTSTVEEGTNRPFGLQRRAEEHEEEQIPSPRSFNNAGREPKSWKQRFGFDKDESPRASSTSRRESGFGNDSVSERRAPRSSKGFGFVNNDAGEANRSFPRPGKGFGLMSKDAGDEKRSSPSSGRGFGFMNGAGSEKRSSPRKGFGLR
jgi:hypothetical protein